MPHLLTSNNKRTHLLTIKDKGVKKMVIKHLPSNNIATKALKYNDHLILSSSKIGARSRKSKHTNKKRKSPKTAAKILSSYNTATKKPDVNDLLIPDPLTESICSCGSSYANTEDEDNT